MVVYSRHVMVNGASWGQGCCRICSSILLQSLAFVCCSHVWVRWFRNIFLSPMSEQAHIQLKLTLRIPLSSRHPHVLRLHLLEERFAWETQGVPEASSGKGERCTSETIQEQVWGHGGRSHLPISVVDSRRFRRTGCRRCCSAWGNILAYLDLFGSAQCLDVRARPGWILQNRPYQTLSDLSSLAFAGVWTVSWHLFPFQAFGLDLQDLLLTFFLLGKWSWTIRDH